MDLFEEDNETLSFSVVPAPDFNNKTFKPGRLVLAHSQESKKFSCVDKGFELEKNWDNYIINLNEPPSSHFSDYFSKRHLREKISTLLLQINQHSSDEIQKRKKDANPYSLLKQVPSDFKYPGVTRMANILKLFPEILEKNYVIPVYQYLTLGDKGGYSEYIVHKYQDQYLEELKGWALFPRSNFKVDGVVNQSEGEINFETIQNFCENLLQETQEASLMLIVNDLSWKENDPMIEEKYMKLYFVYSIYLAVKLLARGGNIIIKLYNTYHPATIELIYMISNLFNTVSVIKLLSSPPHSAVTYK